MEESVDEDFLVAKAQLQTCWDDYPTIGAKEEMQDLSLMLSEDHSIGLRIVLPFEENNKVYLVGEITKDCFIGYEFFIIGK